MDEGTAWLSSSVESAIRNPPLRNPFCVILFTLKQSLKILVETISATEGGEYFHAPSERIERVDCGCRVRLRGLRLPAGDGDEREREHERHSQRQQRDERQHDDLDHYDQHGPDHRGQGA